MSYSIVISTCKNKNEAGKIAQKILKNKLAACANLIPINSSYWWRGKIMNGKETMLILKTKSNNADKIISAIKNAHSYKIPEVIEVKIDKGNKNYLDWIEEVIK